MMSFASVGSTYIKLHMGKLKFIQCKAGVRSAVRSASDSRARGPGLDTWSGHILLFPLQLIKEGQLSVTGKSMCT